MIKITEKYIFIYEQGMNKAILSLAVLQSCSLAVLQSCSCVVLALGSWLLVLGSWFLALGSWLLVLVHLSKRQIILFQYGYHSGEVLGVAIFDNIVKFVLL